MGSILSVNVAQPRTLERRGREQPTGIWKAPMAGDVRVGDLRVGEDLHADLNVHGGPHRAVYAYASEDAAWWAAQLGRELSPGAFGENLTLAGIDVSHALIGERWRAGRALLEVSGARMPCWKLARKMGDPGFVKRFAQAKRPGAYLRTIEPGDVRAGDAVEVASRPDHAVTLELLVAVRTDEKERAPELLAAREHLSPDWLEFALARAA